MLFNTTFSRPIDKKLWDRNENSASLKGFLSNVRRSYVDLLFNIAVDFTFWAATEREFDGLVTWEWLGNAGS